jgi:hypothetical protein
MHLIHAGDEKYGFFKMDFRHFLLRDGNARGVFVLSYSQFFDFRFGDGARRMALQGLLG